VFRPAAITLFCLLLCLKPIHALAGDFVEDQPATTDSTPNGDATDSTFDPFSDYSEFEEGSEEESDLNFFHNGRFFAVGLMGGYEAFTEVLGQIYAPNFNYGVFLSYFFDLRFALQISYGIANHPLDLQTGSADYTGEVSLQHFAFDFKYYLNTQNVTRGLASLNPYLLVGVSDYYRTTTYNGTAGYVRDGAFGVEAGGGVEVPMMHNKAYFGVQATYNYIDFPDRGTQIKKVA